MKDKSKTVNNTKTKVKKGKGWADSVGPALAFQTRIVIVLVALGFIIWLIPQGSDAVDYAMRERIPEPTWYPPPPRRPTVIYRDYRPVNVIIIKPARKRVLGIF